MKNQVKKIQDHDHFMRRALKQAHQAVAHEEVPVGAVIVDPQGTIIARAYNQVETKQTQVAHAELLALAKAGKKYGWRLEGCWMYVTLEPCSMCMHALYLSRLSGVVFGASSPIFGFRLDKRRNYSVYKMPMKIVGGVCADQAADLLKRFFKERRGNSYV